MEAEEKKNLTPQKENKVAKEKKIVELNIDYIEEILFKLFVLRKQIETNKLNSNEINLSLAKIDKKVCKDFNLKFSDKEKELILKGIERFSN